MNFRSKKGNAATTALIGISLIILMLGSTTMYMAKAESSILTNANEASSKSSLSIVKEDLQLAITTVETDYYTDWAEETTFSAYKGVYITEEKLNDELYSLKILNGKIKGIECNFDLTQEDVIGSKKVTNSEEVKKKVQNEEHPICQLVGVKENDLTNANRTKETYFCLYLSDGEDKEDVGENLYVAICEYTTGVPMVKEFGKVNSDYKKEKLANGIVKEKNGKYISDEGVLPSDVEWSK